MEPLPIIVDGYNTLFTECSDASGSFLLIAIPPSAGKDIANLAGMNLLDILPVSLWQTPVPPEL